MLLFILSVFVLKPSVILCLSSSFSSLLPSSLSPSQIILGDQKQTNNNVDFQLQALKRLDETENKIPSLSGSFSLYLNN